MPLTTRTDGSSSGNIIHATWWNDFLNLLTGAMSDQIVTINNELVLTALGAAPSSAAGGSLAAGTNLGVGLYVYVYTYANASGETTASPTFSITTTTNNQKVNLTGITVGPTGTTQRNIYRTAVGGGNTRKFLATINDNTTTTFSDTIADGSLGAALPPPFSTFGGALSLKDSGGIVKMLLSNQGSIRTLMTAVSGSGSVGGTASLYQVISGNLRFSFATEQSLNTATNVDLAFPDPYSNGLAFILTGGVGVSGGGGISLMSNGAAITFNVISAVAGAGGSINAQTVMFSASIAYVTSAFDTLRFVGTGGNARTAPIIIIGN